MRKNSGYIIIINTLIFLTISVVLMMGVVSPVLSHYSSTKSFLQSKKAFQLANSAGEEVLYRLKTNKNMGNSASITLGSSTATISISTDNKTKTIDIDSDVNNFFRNIKIKTVEDVGASFSYGLQSGKGGLIMGNNSYVSGNVYSNGDITASNGAYITGSATVANSSDPTANQSNGTTTPPTSSVNFGGYSTSQDFAQSFQVSTTTAVTSVRLYVKKNTTSATSTMSDVTVRIVTDSSSHPYKTSLVSGTLRYSDITTAYNYVTVPFTSTASLTPGTTYWLVLDAVSATPSTNTNYYSIATSQNTYSNGVGNVGTWSSTGSGGTWSATSPSGQDAYFDIYVGGHYGVISGLDHVGTGGIGDVWAHTVEDISSIAGTLYCQTSDNIGGGKSCNTSRTDPVEQPFPLSDGTIQAWKDVAINGGTYNGNKTYNSGTSYLGPQQINGNLTLDDGTLVLTGTVYVTGTISMTNGAKIKLDPTYGGDSAILVTDGMVNIGNNSLFEGSGASGSYVLVVTTSDCPASPSCSGNNAINVSNNSVGAALLNAQKGTLLLSNNAGVKEATANTIQLDNNTNVEYETGIINANFVSGPSGSWYISSWDEVE